MTGEQIFHIPIVQLLCITEKSCFKIDELTESLPRRTHLEGPQVQLGPSPTGRTGATVARGTLARSARAERRCGGGCRGRHCHRRRRAGAQVQRDGRGAGNAAVVGPRVALLVDLTLKLGLQGTQFTQDGVQFHVLALCIGAIVVTSL